jgi:tRNA modification GTPase
MDLVQAEAVADLIEASTPLQARAAFDQLNGTLTSTIAAIDAQLFDLIARLEASVDFPEEGYHFIEPADLAVAIDAVSRQTTALLRSARRGRMLREGLQVAIVGEPNVGKSSLFNALLGTGRAIVHELPGTTRDLVAETMELEGLRVTLIDTAGLRETAEPVELEGVHRSRRAFAAADLVVHVAAEPEPRWAPEGPNQHNDNKELRVLNKADVASSSCASDVIRVSAKTGQGIEALRLRIAEALDFVDLHEPPAITNVRHVALVERADTALRRAHAAAVSNSPPLSEEFVLADLQDARAALEEVGGRRTTDDVLAHIFERFCIGK